MSELLFRPMRSWLCLVLAGVIGVGYAFAMLGWHFIDSSSEYWRLPEGYSGGPVDMRVILSGYFWFVQDAWRWPLFRIVQADGPIGANAALMDVVPILALVCKLLRGVTGLINPYPAWVIGCFGLNAVALTALVRAMGQRSLLAACTAAAMAAMAPLMHMRFGHHALCAQWIFVFALATYLAHAKWADECSNRRQCADRADPAGILHSHLSLRDDGSNCRRFLSAGDV